MTIAQENKRKLYSKMPVNFPIDFEVKTRSVTTLYRFNHKDKVPCHWCGEEITLSAETVFRYLHPLDSHPKVQCLKCNQITDIAYYANRKNKVKTETWDSEFSKK